MANNESENRSLEEIIVSLRLLGASEDRMERSKEVETIKSNFYKRLSQLKAEAEAAGEDVAERFSDVEQTFKDILSDYKKERAEYNKTQDEIRAENLQTKRAIIEELKTLVEGPLDEVGSSFPKLHELQQRWRETGPVPASDFRFINDTYQFLVEKFYDLVQINHDLRDLDFKKNLEAKTSLCEQAEGLVGKEDIVSSFNALQKLHEAWKDLGPVQKDVREQIWDRFKAATTSINKAYQEFFEKQKAVFAQNLASKQALCEKVEAIAARSDINDPGLWNSLSKEIEDIQKEWKQIGQVARKDNTKIYERFRKACDDFYARKKEFFTCIKEHSEQAAAKKEELIRAVKDLREKAALEAESNWKELTQKVIEIQQQWKESGNLARKKSEQLWTAFRAECDGFFALRDKNASPADNFYANLKAKKALIAELEQYGGEDTAQERAAFEDRFASIGHVPFREKEAISKAWKDALRRKFPSSAPSRRPRPSIAGKPRDPRADLIRKYKTLEQEIATLENNILFFSSSRNAGEIVAQMQQKINAAKEELSRLAQQIKDNEQTNG